MPNLYYAVTGAPGNKASGASAAIRAEFALIAAAFDKMPVLAGNANRPVGVNAAADGFVALTAFEGVAIGAVTPATGRFTTLAATLPVNFAQTLGVGGSVTAGGFIGPLTGNVAGDVIGNTAGVHTGNVTGNVTGALFGNANTATNANFAINATNANIANSALAVPWTGVTGRPTGLSQFTNDVGFITTAGAASASGLIGTTMAANVVASSLTSLGVLSSLTSGAATFNSTASFAGIVSSASQIVAILPAASTIAAATTLSGGIVVQSNGAVGAAAYMSFHRPGAYLIHMGLDTDNVLKVGGFSMGAVSQALVHAGNVAAYAPSPTGVGASGTWAVNISGTASNATFANAVAAFPNRVDANAYQVVWSNGLSTSPAYSCAAVTIQSDIGRLVAASLVATGRVFGNGAGQGLGSITVSTAAPSGGQMGDLWFRY